MAISIVCFDKVSGKTKTITVDATSSVLVQDPSNGDLDTFLKLTVSAKDKAGTTITPFVITGESDLVLGTSQYGGSTAPYGSLGIAVDDYVLRMVQGIPGEPDTAMDFNS